MAVGMAGTACPLAADGGVRRPDFFIAEAEVEADMVRAVCAVPAVRAATARPTLSRASAFPHPPLLAM